MADDIALAVVKRFGIFGVEAGSVLDGGIDDQQDLPGQATDALERPSTAWRKLHTLYTLSGLRP
jgi:hypothetical protein